MLEEIGKSNKNFKIIISEKDKQLLDLKAILQAAKTSYRKVAGKNKQLKQHIVSIKQKQKYSQQLVTAAAAAAAAGKTTNNTTRSKLLNQKSIKELLTKKKVIVT